MKIVETDVLVIGAGPSGSVAASIIKRAGYKVEIVEKTQFPRFVIGESLLPRCLEALSDAGLLEAVEAQNFQEKNGAIFVKDDIKCDFNFKDQYTEGFNYAYQMPRADFDKALADECERKGINVHYQQEVYDVKIAEDGSSTTYVKDVNGNEIEYRARFIVDGSGYGRVIPRLFNLEKATSQATRKTIFCHMSDPLRSEASVPNRTVIYVPEEDVWVWIIPFSNGNTSVGFVAPTTFFDQYEGNSEQVYKKMIAKAPELKDRFAAADFIFEPKTIQGWSATTDTFYGNGFVLTGNVTEFLDPIFSSGVTLATVSAQKAAHLVVKQLGGEKVDWEKEYSEPTKRGVDVFRTYVTKWYDGTLFKIFFAKNYDPQMRSMICSVLAGYVWDEENTFVSKHEKSVSTLARFLTMQDKDGEILEL